MSNSTRDPGGTHRVGGINSTSCSHQLGDHLQVPLARSQVQGRQPLLQYQKISSSMHTRHITSASAPPVLQHQMRSYHTSSALSPAGIANSHPRAGDSAAMGRTVNVRQVTSKQTSTHLPCPSQIHHCSLHRPGTGVHRGYTSDHLCRIDGWAVCGTLHLDAKGLANASGGINTGGGA
jgi:hypothetical protein